MDKRYTTEEQEEILKHVKRNRSLIFSGTTKTNAKEKSKLWEKIANDVNAVSSTKREPHKILKRFSDWKYSLNKGKKKKLSSTDQELLELMHGNDKEHEETNKTEPDGDDDDEDNDLKTRFDEEEQKLLVRSVCSKYDLLFGSFSNIITTESKTKTWTEITKQVNETFNRQRTVKGLKLKWQRIVTSVKAKCADINRANRSSGVHNVDIPQLTPMEDEVKATIGEVAIQGVIGGIDTAVDSDDDTISLSSSNAETNANDLSAQKNVPMPTTKNSTMQLISLEREKLLVMKEQLRIDKERLEVEKDIRCNLGQLNKSLSGWMKLNTMQEPKPIPTFHECFPTASSVSINNNHDFSMTSDCDTALSFVNLV